MAEGGINLNDAADRLNSLIAEAEALLDDIRSNGTSFHFGRPRTALEIAKDLLCEAVRRRAHFADIEFGDPQWLILLELFVAAEEGRQVSSKRLCLAAQVPATTALRHIACLEARGSIRRSGSELDKRAQTLSLPAGMRRKLKSYLLQIEHRQLPHGISTLG